MTIKESRVVTISKVKVDWEMKWGGIHDIHLLTNGNILTQQMPAKVVEIDRKTKKVVWECDAGKSNGRES